MQSLSGYKLVQPKAKPESNTISFNSERARYPNMPLSKDFILKSEL